jgi:hypothetical protein
MSNEDLLEAIEWENETPTGSERTPDISLSGVGDGYSDAFEAPGGVTFVESNLHDNGRYTIKAVGQTAEDSTIKYAHEETPVTHRNITKLSEDTYILNVEADEGKEWSIDIYFTLPPSVSLPVERSGRGDDVVGPIPHEGFIRVVATNRSNSTMTIKQPKENGKGYLNSPSFRVDADESNEGVTKEEIMSTKDGHTNYPWLRIDCDGEWDVEVHAHD